VAVSVREVPLMFHAIVMLREQSAAAARYAARAAKHSAMRCCAAVTLRMREVFATPFALCYAARA